MKRLITPALFVSLVLLAGCASKVEETRAGPVDKEQCLSLYDQELWAQALPNCESALGKNDEENLYIRTGFCHYQLKQYDRAVKVLKNGIQRYPDSRNLHIYLSYCYQDTGHNEEALIEAKTAIEFAPRDSFAWYNLGLVYLHQQKFSMALEALVSSKTKLNLELSPEYCQSKTSNYYCGSLDYKIGKAFEMRGDYGSAQKAYEEAISFDPEHADYREALKRAQDQQKEWKGRIKP